MAIPVPSSVDSVVERLHELLQRAHLAKTEQDILPPISAADILNGDPFLLSDTSSKTPFAIIETAARHVFHELLASASIEDARFVDMWNLLDILQICGDADECDPALALWLIEELLDSQSIEGCRKVFEYLESRREKLIAKNFMKNKNLVVLRMCNELLRRLSRAEDAVFCGRVFIFLFQSFPLGDKSSVNLRGEFHVENVTIFEATVETAQPADPGEMDVDAPEQKPDAPDATEFKNSVKGKSETPARNGAESRGEEQKQPLDVETLYPIFWKLQQAFSNPPLLFNQDHLSDFKHGLEETLLKFKRVPRVHQSRRAEINRGVKRKHDGQADDSASNLNPKYLTSRDLFKLELSDLDFQRYFLVQALILIDFLLSLTEDARAQLAHINPQKSLQYPFTLSEEDTKWATSIRDKIHDYVKNGGLEEEKGRFFIRMVDTILQRDQNWVAWKMESCPPIARGSINSSDFLEAKTATQRICLPRKMKAMPMGALDLTFLSEAERDQGLDTLKAPDRYLVPSEETLIKSIETDELDLDFADGEQKMRLEESMASKTWKTLRIAAKSKLNLFDKIDDKKNLKGFLISETGQEKPKEEPSAAVEEANDEAEGDQANQMKE